jgi:C-terminal processing protease CtpA/Prc
MKKLTDYKGDAAIELWADLLDPLSEILTDDSIRKVVQSGKSKMDIAKEVLKKHKKNATKILLRIDDTPIDGLNIILRLIDLIADIGQNEEIKGFFGYAEQDQKDKESSGSPTENIEAQEK